LRINTVLPEIPQTGTVNLIKQGSCLIKDKFMWSMPHLFVLDRVDYTYKDAAFI
jgi:hypothetical protein